MQSRNKSLLKFQERLIRAALHSPQREAMNLMGIIYSNLDEFIRVRIPMDGDIYGCADELVDTFELFDYVLRMKFPTLYVAQTFSIQFKLNSFNDIIDLYNTMVEGRIGHFIDGLFYHRIAIIKALAYNISASALSFELTESESELLDRYCNEALSYARIMPLNISGSRLDVSVPPYLVRSDDLAVDVVEYWINHQTTKFDCEVIFDWNRNPTDITDNFSITSIQRDTTINIAFNNPLFIRFDQVAKMILSNSERNDALLYNNDIPHFYGVKGITDDKGPLRIFLRTPFVAKDDHNVVIESILHALNRKYDILGYAKKYLNADSNDRAQIIEMARNDNRDSGYCITKAHMSIYRTDHHYDQANVEFLIWMAMILGSNCHIFIEARARDDERNNTELARMLRKLGASIHIQSYGYRYKVHAKIWHFHMQNPLDRSFNIKVLSTGNFVSSAQNGFSDSIIIDRSYASIIGDVTRSFDEYLNYIYYPHKINADENRMKKLNLPFIWYPGDIRRRLIDLIQYSKAGQFIWIKCNHLTDRDIINELIKAARRGVMVRLIVRTTCTIPHSVFKIAGIQQNIAAKSIVGRYLEHDRWFIFGDIEDSVVVKRFSYSVSHAYISSSDLMHRNLSERVEFMYENKDTLRLLPQLFMDMYCKDTCAEQGYFNITL